MESSLRRHFNSFWKCILITHILSAYGCLSIGHLAALETAACISKKQMAGSTLKGTSRPLLKNGNTRFIVMMMLERWCGPYQLIAELSLHWWRRWWWWYFQCCFYDTCVLYRSSIGNHCVNYAASNAVSLTQNALNVTSELIFLSNVLISFILFHTF